MSSKQLAWILARLVVLVVLTLGSLAVLPSLFNLDSDLALIAVPTAIAVSAFFIFLLVRSLIRSASEIKVEL